MVGMKEFNEKFEDEDGTYMLKVTEREDDVHFKEVLRIVIRGIEVDSIRLDTRDGEPNIYFSQEEDDISKNYLSISFEWEEDGQFTFEW